jgi:hypothetical protein
MKTVPFHSKEAEQALLFASERRIIRTIPQEEIMKPGQVPFQP